MSHHIIVCDDDEGVVDITKIVLEEKGYSVTECTNSNEVIDLVKKTKPALLLLDLWMPGIAGDHVAIDLKEDPNTKHIPIIIISASKDGAKVAKYAGADDFLAKPFNIEDLEKKVEKCLKNQGSNL